MKLRTPFSPVSSWLTSTSLTHWELVALDALSWYDTTLQSPLYCSESYSFVTLWSDRFHNNSACLNLGIQSDVKQRVNIFAERVCVCVCVLGWVLWATPSNFPERYLCSNWRTVIAWCSYICAGSSLVTWWHLMRWICLREVFSVFKRLLWSAVEFDPLKGVMQEWRGRGLRVEEARRKALWRVCPKTGRNPRSVSHHASGGIFRQLVTL